MAVKVHRSPKQSRIVVESLLFMFQKSDRVVKSCINQPCKSNDYFRGCQEKALHFCGAGAHRVCLWRRDGRRDGRTCFSRRTGRGWEEAWQSRAVFAGREKERAGKTLGSKKKKRVGRGPVLLWAQKCFLCGTCAGRV